MHYSCTFSRALIEPTLEPAISKEEEESKQRTHCKTDRKQGRDMDGKRNRHRETDTKTGRQANAETDRQTDMHN